MKAIGYIRVSTSEQDISPAAQRERIERWCRDNDAELVACFADEAVSGGADLEKRPGLTEALGALREFGADVLLVTKRDRLARDVVIAGMVQRLAEKAGARVVAADGGGNGTSPEDMLLRGIQDVFAQYERALISFRTSVAMKHKQARGEYIGGRVPYGYVLEDGELVEDEGEQELLRCARELRAAGLSLRAIAGELGRRGFSPRGKARTFAASQISRMVA